PDRGRLAQRRRGASVRGPPAAGRAGGVGLRAEGGAERLLRGAGAVGLRPVRRGALLAAVRGRVRRLLREPALQAGAGDAAVSAAGARLVAAGATTSAGLVAACGREAAAVTPGGRRLHRRVFRAEPDPGRAVVAAERAGGQRRDAL